MFDGMKYKRVVGYWLGYFLGCPVSCSEKQNGCRLRFLFILGNSPLEKHLQPNTNNPQPNHLFFKIHKSQSSRFTDLHNG